jgi:hypothetical protein
MINENALRDALLALATDGRSNYVMISSVSNELAAIREIVRGLDPTSADILDQKRQEAAESDSESVRAVIARYDEIIRRLYNGEVC